MKSMGKARGLRHNNALQRTRSAPLRSPLSFRPLGVGKDTAVASVRLLGARRQAHRVIAMAVMFLTACASLTPEGEKVRITTNPQATAGCTFIANVKGQFNADLRNEAAKVGANMVFNQTQPNEIHIWQHGEAYSCPTPAAGPAQPHG